MIRQAFTDWQNGRASRLMRERLARERQEMNKELGIIEIPTEDGWIEIWLGSTIAPNKEEDDGTRANDEG